MFLANSHNPSYGLSLDAQGFIRPATTSGVTKTLLRAANDESDLPA